MKAHALTQETEVSRDAITRDVGSPPKYKNEWGGAEWHTPMKNIGVAPLE